MTALFFYIFATLTVASAVMVIAAKNPVHSVLFLILTFVNASGLFILLGAEFLAMILIVVYVGAVAVLFLFVVMMLNIDFAELRSGFARYLPVGLVLAIGLAAEIIVGIGAYGAGAIELSRRAAPIDPAMPNIQAIGELLYTRYLFIFEGAGLVLLVAMIGAIVLTHRERGGTRPQNINRQVSRRPQDATRNTQPGIGQGIEL